jgi:hypothetical protein
MSFFDSVLPSFRAVGVSKRRTQTATLVLRLMGRPATSSAESCAGLKRPCKGPCLEGRAKKDISMLTRAFLSYMTLKRRVGVMCLTQNYPCYQMSNTRAKIKRVGKAHAISKKIPGVIALAPRRLRCLVCRCPLLIRKKPMPSSSISPSWSGKTAQNHLRQALPNSRMQETAFAGCHRVRIKGRYRSSRPFRGIKAIDKNYVKSIK